jgi:hypothetical protein
MRSFVLSLVCLCSPVFGQTVSGNSSTIRLGNAPDIQTETRVAASSAPAASLRGLDKMSGESIDIALQTAETAEFGYLKITLQECRYPRDNPTGNAFAHLTILERDLTEPVFDGWMIAASPALVALDHPRYDVWVIRCKLDDRTPSVVAGESSPRPLMRP